MAIPADAVEGAAGLPPSGRARPLPRRVRAAMLNALGNDPEGARRAPFLRASRRRRTAEPDANARERKTMSSETLHAPRERLSKDTLAMHHAITSLMEELEAVDWYRQRADDCEDESLKAILLHNMREEMEHACMVIEWMRRNNKDFAGFLDAFVYKEGEIAHHHPDEDH
jgi:hypothetical protein